VFRRHGFDPENVIHSDFFSEDFQKFNQNRFDAVISRGFIEHFADVKDVINRHLEILAPGGILIVSVPNLRGVNYGLARIFHKEVLALHNLDIMTKDVFAKLFDRSNVRPLFCDYYGTFSLYLFTSGSPYRQHALRAVQRIQAPLNLAFRTLLKDKGAECPIFSPSLLYIGRKM
jgi:SAM-dependent methyltransferase